MAAEKGDAEAAHAHAAASLATLQASSVAELVRPTTVHLLRCAIIGASSMLTSILQSTSRPWLSAATRSLDNFDGAS